MTVHYCFFFILLIKQNLTMAFAIEVITIISFSYHSTQFNTLHINLSYLIRDGTAEKKHFLLIKLNNAHMMFLLQIDKTDNIYRHSDLSIFNVTYFLITSNTIIRKCQLQITITVTMLTLASPIVVPSNINKIKIKHFQLLQRLL